MNILPVIAYELRKVLQKSDNTKKRKRESTEQSSDQNSFSPRTVRASTKEKSMLRDEGNRATNQMKSQKQKTTNKEVPKLIFNQKDLLLDALDTEVRKTSQTDFHFCVSNSTYKCFESIHSFLFMYNNTYIFQLLNAKWLQSMKIAETERIAAIKPTRVLPGNFRRIISRRGTYKLIFFSDVESFPKILEPNEAPVPPNKVRMCHVLISSLLLTFYHRSSVQCRD